MKADVNVLTLSKCKRSMRGGKSKDLRKMSSCVLQQLSPQLAVWRAGTPTASPKSLAGLHLPWHSTVFPLAHENSQVPCDLWPPWSTHIYYICNNPELVIFFRIFSTMEPLETFINNVSCVTWVSSNLDQTFVEKVEVEVHWVRPHALSSLQNQ